MADVPVANGNGAKLVNNAALTVMSRLAMILATAALPVAGWMVLRGINAVDDVAKKVDTIRDQTLETNGNVKLIQQTQTIQGATLADHESRMRTLERKPPP